MNSILKSPVTRSLSLFLAFLMLFINVSPSILACGPGSPGDYEWENCNFEMDGEWDDYEDFELDDYDWDDYEDFDKGDFDEDDFGGEDFEEDDYEDVDDYDEWEDYEDIEDAGDFDSEYDEDFEEFEGDDDFDGEDIDLEDMDDDDVDIDEDFDFDFGEEDFDSCDEGGCGVDNSVNGFSGNLHLKIDLFTLKTKGVPIPISLHYNSQGGTINRPFGDKWKYNFDISVEWVEFPEWMDDPPDLIVRRSADGGSYYYERVKAWGYLWLPSEGHQAKLEEQPDGTWLETMKNGIKYHFDTFNNGGRLLSIESSNGNPVSFYYDSDNIIDYITCPTGRVIDFIRHPNPTTKKIVAIEPPDGETYSLTYTGGRLTKYENPVGAYVDFAYDGYSRILSRTYSPVNGDYYVSYTYTGNKVQTRVKHSGTTTQTRSFNYGPLRTTTITDEGYKRKIVTYNDFGQPKEIKYYGYNSTTEGYDHLRTEKKKYGADGSLLWSEDGRGYRTRYEYDHDTGNRTLKQFGTQTGSTFNVIDNVHYTYNSQTHPDGPGKLSSKTNARGHSVNYEYYPGGNLKRKEWEMTGYDDVPHTIEEYRTYYPDGLLKTVEDPRGKTTTFSYDTHGNLAEINKSSGLKVTKYTCDDMGRRMQEKELINYNLNTWRITDYERDGIGRVTEVTYNGDADDFGEFNYNCCSLQWSKDRDGNVTHYQYHPTGKLWRKYQLITNSLGPDITAECRYGYDGLDRLVTEVDSNENRTVYEYDGLDRVIRIAHHEPDVGQDYGPLVDEVEMEYDANSNLTSKKVYLNDSPIITTMGYDEHNRLTSVSAPISATETAYTYYDYDEGGNMTYFRDAENRVSTFVYDEMGHLIKSTELPGMGAMEKVTLYRYDYNGNLKGVKDDLGRETTFDYDNVNRLIDSYKPIDGRTLHTQYAYDNIGNMTSVKLYDVVGSEDHTTTYQYDDDCRLVKKTDPEGKKVDYAYLKSGKLELITDDNGRMTHYFYDQAGRMIRVAYAAHLGDIQREESFYYDGVGNLTKKKLRSGDEIEYEYDARNMLSKKTYPAPDNKTIDYVYDDLGRLDEVTMSGGYGTIAYDYDDLNRLTTVTHPGNVLVHYNYDKVGNRTRVTYPGSYLINYTYDSLNRTDLVQDGSYNTLADYGYDTIRRINLRRDPNGMNTRTDYDYNNANWFNFLRNFDVGTQNDISRFTYTYDRAGNRRTMTRNTNQDNYTYNKRYELTEVNYAPGSSFDDQTFIYDGVGNREGVIKGGAWVEYTANPLNQYSSVDGVSFSCDSNGNLTDDGTHTYYYDLDNHLTKIIRNSDSQVIAEYKYDPFGRRIQKLINVPSYQLINYLYDGGRVIEERDGSNNLIQRYIYGAGIDEVLILEKANGDKYWYYYDALGNVVNLTDNDGDLACTYYYDVYGDFTESGAFTDNPYKFTGRRYDPESDLYFYRARMYSPTLGRFMQTDPAGYVDGPNLYSYVGNNPLGWIDPLGFWTFGIGLSGSFDAFGLGGTGGFQACISYSLEDGFNAGALGSLGTGIAGGSPGASLMFDIAWSRNENITDLRELSYEVGGSGFYLGVGGGYSATMDDLYKTLHTLSFGVGIPGGEGHGYYVGTGVLPFNEPCENE